MTVFLDTKELHRVMADLWGQAIGNDPGISGELIKSRLCVQFHYREPDGLITVDCTDGQQMRVTAGPSAVKPVVEMFMK